jgi:hypothetical protein
MIRFYYLIGLWKANDKVLIKWGVEKISKKKCFIVFILLFFNQQTIYEEKIKEFEIWMLNKSFEGSSEMFFKDFNV